MSGIIARRGTMVSGEKYALTSEMNAPLMAGFWKAYGANGTITPNKIAHSTYITMEEADTFTGNALNPNRSPVGIFPNIKNLKGLENFKNIHTIPMYCFRQGPIVEAVIPENITQIATLAFQSCNSLKTIDILSPSINLDQIVFINAPNVTSISIRRLGAQQWANYTKDPWGNNASSTCGYNGRATGNNTLHLPQGATGYDSEAWQRFLLSPNGGGFHISYDL